MPEISWNLYQIITWSWIGVGLITFIYLFRQTAPYGRHSTTTWGPMIDNRLGWFLMEFPVLIFMAFQLKDHLSVLSTPIYIAVSLFALHYINRSLIFPLRIRTKGKKMPFAITLMAICFNLMNGNLLGYYFAHFADYPDSWLTDPRFITGVLLFFAGLVINWVADHKLIHLRKPGETGYKIPRGWLFDFISSPNLFGEIIEWGGFALLTWSLPGLAFFVWTFANLVPRAVSHHKWYKEKFPDYPLQRKAVLPGIL